MKRQITQAQSRACSQNVLCGKAFYEIQEAPMEQYSLTYDFGSGSLKAALVNAQHRIAASCNLAYSTIFPQKGWAERG